MSEAVTAAGAVRAVLERHGVRSVFALAGASQSVLIDDLDRHGIRVVQTRHESATVGAADGYARVRRGIGWNFLLWFVIGGLMITTRHLLVVGVLGVVAAAVWVPVALWLARREMQKHARSAAQASGLQEMR